MNITFIGGGNMAAAMIGGLLQRGSSPEMVTVAEVNADRRAQLQHQFGIHASPTVIEAGINSEICVLAVKPQQLRTVATENATLLHDKLVISIAAGIRAADLSVWMGNHPRIIRAMPNTPCLIGKGMTGLYALPGVGVTQKLQAADVLGAVGSVIWFDDEAQLDAVTAISGSGPAYVFYLLEAMQQAGTELGLSPETARQLSLETFVGASLLAAESHESFSTLRARVTSPGGTTEQAILSLEKANVKSALTTAIEAAYKRSQEIGHILGQS
ncbi:MAG: pyrroline-5-carboxylate reductase [Nitrosomonas sp.]|nr:pyrroline-5-carboxylate reductase [Nitrosomonas sp.]